ncbi:MAG: PaaX family transcriptional regulator C-terminal domain-containing protein [Pseudomonadota bacterium]
MLTDPYRASLDALTSLGPLRVWSVLVTVFGDLAPDQPIVGPALTALMSEIGIKPEATRVALHRLRGDGWIISQKVGRHSQHALSPTARADSAEAWHKIYGQTPNANELVLILLPPKSKSPDPAQFARVGPRLYAASRSVPMPADAMMLNSGNVPSWLGIEVETAALQKSYTDLLSVLRDVESLPPELTKDPLARAALRVLIVHNWRRLALKHALLPREAHSADWAGHDARDLVISMLARLKRASPDDLNPR